jgi:hypothetical protein
MPESGKFALRPNAIAEPSFEGFRKGGESNRQKTLALIGHSMTKRRFVPSGIDVTE